MTEQDLVSKVEELMSLLDQAKIYRKIVASLTNLVIIVLSITCISLLILIFMKFLFITSGLLFIVSGFSPAYGFSYTPQFVLFLFLLPSLFATVIGLILIQVKVKLMRVREMTPLLKEGVPAAIKLLIETDWESAFGDIEFIKQGLTVKMLTAVFFNYFVGLLCFGQLFFLLLTLLIAPIRYDLVGLGALIFAIPITMFMSRRNIKEFCRNIRSINLLIIDLRWLYNELKGARLEA